MASNFNEADHPSLAGGDGGDTHDGGYIGRVYSLSISNSADSEVWQPVDASQEIREYLGDFASNYSEKEMDEIASIYDQKVEAAAEAAGVRNLDDDLAIAASWLRNRGETEILDEFNSALHEFDEAHGK